jgi:hypothetical protein
VSFLFEQALRDKCEKNPDLALLQAQWEYDRRLVADALQTVGYTFPHYSRHDVSHSNSILGCRTDRVRGAVFGRGVLGDWPRMPRMICPFVGVGINTGARVTLPRLPQLVECTAQNADCGQRNERKVAQAMWDFIVEADQLMADEWKGDKKGYNLEEARRDLARWLD